VELAAPATLPATKLTFSYYLTVATKINLHSLKYCALEGRGVAQW
jgi:hypothetical protein